MGMLHMYYPALAEPSDVNIAERTMSVVITARRQDRDGDVVEPAGLNFSAYLKNPVVLWAHALDSTPVGRTVAVRVEDEQVIATVQFADTDMGRELFDLYRQRYLSGWSIGFIPITTAPLESPTGHGVRILTAEVVELSAVPVPSNPDALTRGLGQSLRVTAHDHVQTKTSPRHAAPCHDASGMPSTREKTHVAKASTLKQPCHTVSPMVQTRAAKHVDTNATASSLLRNGIPARKAMDAVYRWACGRMREEISLAIRHARGELEPVA